MQYPIAQHTFSLEDNRSETTTASEQSTKFHHRSLAFLLLPLLSLSVSSATDFDFFYHVQQWPGSFCDTAGGCCFPGGAKPAADFGIHGLWPNYAACRPEANSNRTRCWPEFCSSTDALNVQSSLTGDMRGEMDQNWASLSCKSSNDSNTAFWSHEWSRHGNAFYLLLAG